VYSWCAAPWLLKKAFLILCSSHTFLWSWWGLQWLPLSFGVLTVALCFITCCNIVLRSLSQFFHIQTSQKLQKYFSLFGILVFQEGILNSIPQTSIIFFECRPSCHVTEMAHRTWLQSEIYVWADVVKYRMSAMKS